MPVSWHPASATASAATIALRRTRLRTMSLSLAYLITPELTFPSRATDRLLPAERCLSPVERQRAGPPLGSLARPALSVEMSLDSVFERRSRTLVDDIAGPGSAEHRQERSAIGVDASGYMSHRGAGLRAIEAAHKAGGHFGRKAPSVAFDVADTRTINLDSPNAVERPGTRKSALDWREGQGDADCRCSKAPSVAHLKPPVWRRLSRDAMPRRSKPPALGRLGLRGAHVADRSHKRQSAAVRPIAGDRVHQRGAGRPHRADADPAGPLHDRRDRPWRGDHELRRHTGRGRRLHQPARRLQRNGDG